MRIAVRAISRRAIVAGLLGGILAALVGSGFTLAAAEAPKSDAAPESPKHRPDRWAVKLDRPGLPNLYRVNKNLYRGAQPTAEGIAELKKLGIKTIVGLRYHHSDKKLLGSTGIVFEPIPMQTQSPKEEEVVRFLQIVTDKKRQPVFVHCKHGSDRTGTMLRRVPRRDRRLDETASHRGDDPRRIRLPLRLDQPAEVHHEPRCRADQGQAEAEGEGRVGERVAPGKADSLHDSL